LPCWELGPGVSSRTLTCPVVILWDLRHPGGVSRRWGSCEGNGSGSLVAPLPWSSWTMRTYQGEGPTSTPIAASLPQRPRQATVKLYIQQIGSRQRPGNYHHYGDEPHSGPQSRRKNHHARLDSSVGVGQSGGLIRAGYSRHPPGDEVRTNRRERPCGRGCRRHPRLCGRVAFRPGTGCWIGERVPSRLLLLWFWKQPGLRARIIMRSLRISRLDLY
jgi:hypothetical protein